MSGGNFTIADLDRVRYRLGVTPSQGKLLLALYGAFGEVVPTDDLLDLGVGDDCGPDVLRAQLSYCRRRVGRKNIPNVWCRGYRLTEEGLEVVRKALAA